MAAASSTPVTPDLTAKNPLDPNFEYLHWATQTYLKGSGVTEFNYWKNPSLPLSCAIHDRKPGRSNSLGTYSPSAANGVVSK